MELLTQCSRILYDEEMLRFKKNHDEMKKENEILHPPKVTYADHAEWNNKFDTFNKHISNFILNYNINWLNIPNLMECNHNNDFLKYFNIQYKNALCDLLKHSHDSFCAYKSNELCDIIQMTFGGLNGITKNGGRGSYSFTNWRAKDYITMILEIINNFHYIKKRVIQNEFWLVDIPKFNENNLWRSSSGHYFKSQNNYYPPTGGSKPPCSSLPNY